MEKIDLEEFTARAKEFVNQSQFVRAEDGVDLNETPDAPYIDITDIMREVICGALDDVLLKNKHI